MFDRTRQADLRSAEDVDALAARLTWLDRPATLEVTSANLSAREARRLERDITACGCAAGAAGTVASLIVLLTFFRGPLTWGLAVTWLAVLAAGTLAAKLGALGLTLHRARRRLRRLRRVLPKSTREPERRP